MSAIYRDDAQKASGNYRELKVLDLLAFISHSRRPVARRFRGSGWLISVASQHRQPGIFRKARIVLRKPAQIKRAAAPVVDDPDVAASLAKADFVIG